MTYTIGSESPQTQTTIRQLITDALREGGILALGTTPEAAIEEEGLRLVNRLFLSFLGNEMGDQLITVPFGANGVDNAYGKAEDRESYIQTTYVPSNFHLLCNIDGTQTVYLNPNPMDGARLAVTDNAKNFSTSNLIVNANGRSIEDETEITLDVDGTNSQWFYRADLGGWQKVSNLTINDVNPFPMQFDNLFSTMLALRLNPRYGQTMAQETISELSRMKSQFRSKYRQVMEVHSELGIVRLPSQKKYFNYAVPLYRFNRGY